MDIIHNRLTNDPTLSERTKLTPDEITKLLKQCLHTTYFIYNGEYYRQIHGAAMGSPVSPIVCNLYMEELEQRALQTAAHPPAWWYRYVDDTHVKIKSAHAQEFTEHLNNLDPDIKFTTECEENQSLAFLDTNTIRQSDGSLKIVIYRKPTHTDQYLNFESNHPIEHKLSVIRTLYHRAESVVTDPEEIRREIEHIDTALVNCGYPRQLLDSSKSPNDQQTPVRQTDRPQSKGTVTLPYVRSVSEPLRRIFESYQIKVCLKPTDKLHQQLVRVKDKTRKEDTLGPIYQINCEGATGVTCDKSYIGETERSLRTRFLEHRRRSSTSQSEVALHLHVDAPDHSVSLNEVRVLDREPKWLERGIKEAIYIRKHQPPLNRDGGRYQLSHAWDRLLQSSAINNRTSDCSQQPQLTHP